jgi:hypothetical protein
MLKKMKLIKLVSLDNANRSVSIAIHVPFEASKSVSLHFTP